MAANAYDCGCAAGGPSVDAAYTGVYPASNPASALVAQALAEAIRGVRPKILRGHTLASAAKEAVSANDVMSEECVDLVVRVYNTFRGQIAPAFTDGVIDSSPVFWIELVTDMMMLGNKFRIPGQERKQVLLEVIELVIANEIPDDRRKAARDLVDVVVSPAIDVAVLFTRKIAEVKCNCGKWRCC
jgi:hypothetical protein